jgi:putative tricarboxylic transport membrane protein
METFDCLLHGFSVVFAPTNLLYCFVGVFLGTIVGVLPGLGNAGAIAILLPISYYFSDAGALMLLAGIYYGAQYGGSTTSILLNIPGEGTAMMTCLDGYQMHRKGRGGPALGISAFGSFIAGTGGIIAVTLFATTLVEWALEFGPIEYFGLAILGLTLVSFLSRGSSLKGVMMAVFGMLVASIGLDPMRASPRLDFGSTHLLSGIALIVIGMGMFGLSEVFNLIAKAPDAEEIIKPPKRFLDLLPSRQDWKDSYKAILRGSLVGFLIGVLPGGGGILATITSYSIEKRVSKHPERFGTGEIAGVAGPESANNGSSAGAMIPLLTLGIPSNVNVALLLAALMLHGITPGPMFMKSHPDVFWGVIASMYIGNALLLVLNLPLIGLFTKISYVPQSILTPIIVFLCLIGVYLVNNSPDDILIMVFFGVFAYLIRKYRLQIAPFILGYILGPLVETTLRQSLIISDGDFGIFVSRPLPVIFLSLAFLVWIWPLLSKLWTKKRGT